MSAQKISIAKFKRTIWSHYRSHKREMPWRTKTSPYWIAVSEVMLQQTQANRVVKKFGTFMKRFPDWRSLAKAPTREVLAEWSGLGYNRRALYIQRIALAITNNGRKKGALPQTYAELRKLPGIGPNTAGSILAFAFNIPHPFIETNVRSVYIHFFFGDTKKKVLDSKLMPLIEQTLDKENPREWYWALMDYGAHLKSEMPNPSRKSAHHVKQSAFKGSNRELRSNILRMIMKNPASTEKITSGFEKGLHEQVHANLTALSLEGFIEKKGNIYQIV